MTTARPPSPSTGSPTVADSLQLANGVPPGERARVVDALGRLDDRLRSFPAGTVELALSVKERDTPSQHTTLEAWISGQPRLVATSTRIDFDAAVIEVRDELIRQITDAKNRAEPRHNRAHRDSLRATGPEGEGSP